jgi:hypothetical protein
LPQIGDNSSKSGNNTSDKCLLAINIANADWWGNFAVLGLKNPVTITQANRYLHVKVYRSIQPKNFRLGFNDREETGEVFQGTVLVCAGGAFQYRNDANDGTPVAHALSELGYQSFVVNYRLRPYTQQEGALDLARAVRFVRAHADYYGIDEENIAVAGFSAGGNSVRRNGVELQRYGKRLVSRQPLCAG